MLHLRAEEILETLPQKCVEDLFAPTESFTYLTKIKFVNIRVLQAAPSIVDHDSTLIPISGKYQVRYFCHAK